MQNFFKTFARLFYYVYCVVALGSVAVAIWFTMLWIFRPSDPAYEWATFFLAPILLLFILGTLTVEFVIFKLLQRLTDPTRQHSAVTNTIISIVFIVLLTIGGCAGYIYLVNK